MSRPILAFAFLLMITIAACGDDDSGGPTFDVEVSNDTGDIANDAIHDGQTDTSNDVPLDAPPDAFESCVPVPDGEEVCDNGFDDDCDGRVDEGCQCLPTQGSQECYLGHPDDLNGDFTICSAGTQPCELEFWGDCVGAQGPVEEVCDDTLDNDCDGDVDEDCSHEPPVASCPADSSGSVLDTHTLTGSYGDPNDSPMATAFWSLTSWPPGHSHDLRPSGLEISFFADVAGDYVFTLTVQNSQGASNTCETTFTALTHDILRIEMYWNATVQDEPGQHDTSDFDLYLIENPETLPDGWQFYYRDPVPGAHPNGDPNPNVCHWLNCITCPIQDPNSTAYNDWDCTSERQWSSWNSSQRRECLCREYLSDRPAEVPLDAIWPVPTLDWGEDENDLNDPRLDLDDNEGKGPENINVRRPDAGTYRIAVHFFAPDGFQGVGEIDTSGRYPGVVELRILCNGEETWQSDPTTLYGRDTGLDPHWLSDFWEVGDLTVTYDGDNASCTFLPIGEEGCPSVCRLEDSADLAPGCPVVECAQ